MIGSNKGKTKPGIRLKRPVDHLP